MCAIASKAHIEKKLDIIWSRQKKTESPRVPN